MIGVLQSINPYGEFIKLFSLNSNFRHEIYFEKNTFYKYKLLKTYMILEIFIKINIELLHVLTTKILI